MSLDRQQQSDRRLSEARTALEAGQVGHAADALADVLRLRPDSADGWLALARLHLESGRFNEALSDLDAHDRYHPDRIDAPEAMFLRARVLLRRGDDVLALNYLTRLCDEYPDDTRPHLMRAGLCLRIGDTDAAAAHLRQLVRLEPNNLEHRRLLAALTAGRDPQDAVRLLARSTDAADKLQVARYLVKAGREREADELYEQLLHANAQEGRLWLEAGELADAMGAHPLAIRRLKQATKYLRPRGGAGYAALARAHMHAGRFAAAGRCWWLAGRCGEVNLDADAGLFLCAAVSRRARLAQAAMHRLTIHASSQERRQTLAQLWQHAAGGLAITRALRGETQPHEPAESRQQILRHAALTLDRQRDQFPQRADMHYHFAVAAESLGDRPAASDAALQALAINPRYTAAMRLAGRVTRPSKIAA